MRLFWFSAFYKAHWLGLSLRACFQVSWAGEEWPWASLQKATFRKSDWCVGCCLPAPSRAAQIFSNSGKEKSFQATFSCRAGEMFSAFRSGVVMLGRRVIKTWFATSSNASPSQQALTKNTRPSRYWLTPNQTRNCPNKTLSFISSQKPEICSRNRENHLMELLYRVPLTCDK